MTREQQRLWLVEVAIAIAGAAVLINALLEHERQLFG
jgi:hypothetical protein